jgi:hypothetical protein
MADQALTTLFVVPTANTLPTTGSTNNLTSGQFGIYLPDNTPATVGTVGPASYIYMAQGRNVYSPIEGSLKSDQIQVKNIIRWYKVLGSLSANNQVTEITSLTAGCNENVSITLRLSSYYINAAYDNGLTRSVMVTTPCCNCGENPCDTLSAADIQSTMQALAQAINSDIILNKYVTAGTNGSGATTSIWIQGVPIQVYGQGTSTDLTNFPYQYDRAYFWTFVYSGPELTTDYNVIDACNSVATATILQRASFAPSGAPYEVQQMERDYFYDQHDMRQIFSNVNFNGEYTTYVDSASAYDLYYLNFFEPVTTGRDIGVTRKDEWVCIAVPNGATCEAGLLAILTAFLGTPENASVTVTTSTTYTTSSTTSTTTTLTTP